MHGCQGAKNVKSALSYQVSKCATIMPRKWTSERLRKKKNEDNRACDDNDARFNTESRSQERVLMLGSTSRQTRQLFTERCFAERATFPMSDGTVIRTAAATQTALPLQPTTPGQTATREEPSDTEAENEMKKTTKARMTTEKTVPRLSVRNVAWRCYVSFQRCRWCSSR